MMNTQDFYQTCDLALAALLSLSIPVQAIDRGDPKRAAFIFLRDEEMDEVIEAYFRRELSVEPQAYFGGIRAMKARLYGNG